jgi:hypothetical protein
MEEFSTPANNGLAVDPTGMIDSTTGLMKHLAMLTRNGDAGYWGPGTYLTSSELIATDGPITLMGAGPQRTIVKTVSSAFNGLRINTGGGLQPTGRLFGIGVLGPVPRPSTKNAGIVLDNSPLFVLDHCQASNFDIGFDFINNCFNACGYNLSVPRFGTCNVGVYLRRGVQSGSDIKFYNSLLFPWLHAICVEGQGGGFSFFGGQVSALNTALADQNGVLMLGWDYINKTEFDGVGLLLLQQIEWEGWVGCHAIRQYGEAQATFRDCAFTATQRSRQALAVYMGTNLKNSIIKWDGCAVSGLYADPHLATMSGNWPGNPRPLRQTDWYVPPAGYAVSGIAKGNPLTDITA